jgi:hypothetical protein
MATLPHSTSLNRWAKLPSPSNAVDSTLPFPSAICHACLARHFHFGKPILISQTLPNCLCNPLLAQVWERLVLPQARQHLSEILADGESWHGSLPRSDSRTITRGATLPNIVAPTPEGHCHRRRRASQGKRSSRGGVARAYLTCPKGFPQRLRPGRPGGVFFTSEGKRRAVQPRSHFMQGFLMASVPWPCDGSCLAPP